MLLILPLAFALADSIAGAHVLVLDDRPEINMQIKPYDLPAVVDLDFTLTAMAVEVVWSEIISERTVHAYQPASVPAIDEVPARCNSPPWVHRLKAFK